MQRMGRNVSVRGECMDRLCVGRGIVCDLLRGGGEFLFGFVGTEHRTGRRATSSSSSLTSQISVSCASSTLMILFLCALFCGVFI